MAKLNPGQKKRFKENHGVNQRMKRPFVGGILSRMSPSKYKKSDWQKHRTQKNDSRIFLRSILLSIQAGAALYAPTFINCSGIEPICGEGKSIKRRG
jgi:hypothetical protein